ncbi:MAG TPA: hypothetical protein VNF99_06365 [Stellaceae bacterium]|nr:hypothetical protein [Stellaceae bacterium]
MRSYFLAAFMFLGLFAIVSPASAQPISGQAQIQALLAQYPNGGAGLTAAITAAVEANPALAADVAAVALNANPAQQEAMGTGLADAANFFGSQGTVAGNAARDEILTAAANGPPDMVAAVDAAIEPTAGGGPNGAFGGLVSNFQPSSQHSCVSPSRPGPC